MEIGNKDVYEYISNFADDKTIINMILANKKVFDNEKFYEKVMQKRYPVLLEFRLNNETWKALYLRMVYILAKLQEDYQIPYIPTKGCNPQILLDSQRKDIYDNALRCAAAGGNKSLIDYFLNKGGHIDVAFEAAVQYSNVGTVKYLISKGVKNYNFLLEYASRFGNIDIMKFTLDELNKKGFNINLDFGSGRAALLQAIMYGKLNSVKFLVENGLFPFSLDIEYAERQGKYDIGEYLRNIKYGNQN